MAPPPGFFLPGRWPGSGRAPGTADHALDGATARARTIAPMTSDAAAPTRVPRLSYFFPAHNEEANLEGLVAEALEVLPTLADTFEIIAVDDGSRDGTPALADALSAAHPGVVRAVHHPTNLGYGAALRSGFGGRPLRARRVHRRGPPVQGGRHRAVDRAAGRGGCAGCRRRLPDQARGPAHPDALRARVSAGQPDLLRPQDHRRRLRLQALPSRGARGPARRIGRRLLLGRDDHQAARGRAARSSRSACRTIHAPPARPPGRSRRSSCGPSGISGCSGCGCGPIAAARCAAASRWCSSRNSAREERGRRARPSIQPTGAPARRRHDPGPGRPVRSGPAGTRLDGAAMHRNRPTSRGEVRIGAVRASKRPRKVLDGY